MNDVKWCLALLSTMLLGACGEGDGVVRTSDEPAVAISKIDGPRVGGQAGALIDAVDALAPRTGALLVAAAQQYDPVTGQTSDNPISVYVTASDEEGVSSVELLLDNTSMGTYLAGSDAQMFKNPFIFPAPQSGLVSVPIPGASSGLVPSQLRALATDVSGQVSESAVLELLADGSRPDLTFSVSGDGPPYTGSVTLTGQAGDPETGIRSFNVFINGEAQEINPATPNSFDLVTDLEPGLQTVRLVAVNGVYVPSEAAFTFTVVEEEEPTDPVDPPTDPDPVDPPTDPVDPPTDPVDPPTDPVDPPTDPVDPPTDPVDPPTDPEPGAPTITRFVADPSSIASGATSTLSWEIEGTVTEVTISPEVGDVTTDDDQQVTVSPTETTTYTITATNEAGSDAQAVTVKVTAVDDNGGVEAVDDAAETAAGEPVIIAVLENDEPNAEALTIVRATAPVKGGEVTISRDSRTITYTPPAGFFGTDTFRYTVRDGEGNTSTATVTVQVGTPD